MICCVIVNINEIKHIFEISKLFNHMPNEKY